MALDFDHDTTQGSTVTGRIESSPLPPGGAHVRIEVLAGGVENSLRVPVTEDGGYRLENVPAGEGRMSVWWEREDHKSTRYKVLSIAIGANEDIIQDVRLFGSGAIAGQFPADAQTLKLATAVVIRESVPSPSSTRKTVFPHKSYSLNAPIALSVKRMRVVSQVVLPKHCNGVGHISRHPTRPWPERVGRDAPPPRQVRKAPRLRRVAFLGCPAPLRASWWCCSPGDGGVTLMAWDCREERYTRERGAVGRPCWRCA